MIDQKIYIKQRVTPRDRLDELVSKWNKFELEAIDENKIKEMKAIWNEIQHLSNTFDLPTGTIKIYFV